LFCRFSSSIRALFNVTSAGVGSADDIAGVKPHCLIGCAAIFDEVEGYEKGELLNVWERRLKGAGGGDELVEDSFICLHK
jgi:hypothetical protein